MSAQDTRRSLNALPPGTTLRDYVIESELGSGGFSIVYLARHHLKSDWLYAIKEYFPGELTVRGRDGTEVHPVSTEAQEHFNDGLRRFRDEAEQLRKFRNEGSIVSCLNYFEENGTAYLVMDYDDGLPLSELLRLREKAGQPFTEEDLLAVVEPLLEGLAVVHRAGVLHRDIKPGNIFVRRQDDITGRPAHPVLIDFGAAKQNYMARHSRSRAPHTPGYAAYEQILSEGEMGPWTDVYAVGALMWRIVAGGSEGDERLFVSDGSGENGGDGGWSPTPPPAEKRAYALHRGRPDPMASAVKLGAGRFSPALLASIDRCLALYPENRVRSVGELRSLIDGAGKAVGAARPSGMEHTPTSQVPPRVKASRIRVGNVVAAVAVVLLLSTIGGYLLLRASTDRTSLPDAAESSSTGTLPNSVVDEPAPPPSVTGGPVIAGDSFADTLSSGGNGPEMVVIPAGSFQMGCVSGVHCHDSEVPVHEVTIPQAFAVSRYEVTFDDWDRCVAGGGCSGYRPDDRDWGRHRRPVINVSWNDAREYVEWLSSRTGQTYRLLSEAEWEYVARAGSATAYSWGDAIGSNRANCINIGVRRPCGDQWETPAPVGSFPANSFGLYDMHGNVLEWVEDCWNESYANAPRDGSAWLMGDCNQRVSRGGSWLNEFPRNLRSANRSRNATGFRYVYHGFRVARMLTP